MPSLSVIMATFNGETWLGEQLRSIAQQTRVPDELIVTDDGSTDRTVEIAREFSETAPFPVRLLKGPARGHAENFWSASMLCTSDFISWSDQDDVWHPRKLEVSEAALVVSNASVVSHSATVTDEQLAPLKQRFPNYRSAVVLDRLEGDPWFVMPGFSLLVRREILTSIDWSHRPLSHQSGVLMGPDHAISLVTFAEGKRTMIPEPLAFYRQHSRNLAGAPRSLALRDSMRIGLEEYRTDANSARAYLEFLKRCGIQSSDLEDYFGALISRCSRRADIYEKGSLPSRIQHLGKAVLHGVYGSRDKGRYRMVALAKDSVEVLTGSSRRTASM